MQNLRIDHERLWESLMAMAKIGATEKGGSKRLALTDLDREGRDLFVRWARRRAARSRSTRWATSSRAARGRDPDAPPVMTGSHLDTQPTGGRFDGVYGVLAGLEVFARSTIAATRPRRRSKSWSGPTRKAARFAPAMVASGVFAGVFDARLRLGVARIVDGKTIGEELKRIGYAGEEPIGGRKIGAFFEAHIEQGPILEAERQDDRRRHRRAGQRWYEITVDRQEAMPARRRWSRRRCVARRGAHRRSQSTASASHPPGRVARSA